TDALKLAKEVNDPMQKGGVLNFLITAYEKQGDFKSAYYNLQNYYALGDSIQGQSVREEILRKEMQRSEEHTSELQSRENLVCRPPSASLFPYTTLFRSNRCLKISQRSKRSYAKRRCFEFLNYCL